MDNNINRAENSAVFGIFDDRVSLEDAVSKLKTAGFKSTDVSLLMPVLKGIEGNPSGPLGNLLGTGALSWLSEASHISIPGMGTLIASGPIVGAITGTDKSGTGGAVAAGLVALGISETKAKQYESVVLKGGILLSVHLEDWRQKAMDLLEAYGAHGVENVGEENDSFYFLSQQQTGSDFDYVE